MSFIFEIPAKLIPKILSGQYARYGTIIKDVASGRIVGHLVETPLTSSISSNLPILGRIISSQQNAEVINVLKDLKLITTVGTSASILGLAVSVAGFVAVLNKLNKMDKKLDEILFQLEQIKSKIDELKLQIQNINEAKFISANKLFELAMNSEKASDRDKYLDETFFAFNELRTLYKILYHQLNPGPFHIYNLPVESALNLFGRYLVSSSAMLKIAFIRNDYSMFCKLRDETMIDINEMKFRYDEAFRTRSDEVLKKEKWLYTQYINDEIKNKLSQSLSVIDESYKQIDSYIYQFEYLRNNKLDAYSYIRNIEKLIKTENEKGIILVQH